jgi:prepilin-type N-terminal cleavage/methylation domain-containing protein
MIMKKQINRGFTLIELLMVIAIIGILAGILIPTVGAVKKQANIAASKSQLSSYVSAMQMFKGEYGYFPFTGEVEINEEDDFMPALSGTPSADASSAGNRRRIAFHSFSESEFYVDSEGTSDDILSDRFNNIELFLQVDNDGDGIIYPSPDTIDKPDTSSNALRAEVTAWVEEDEDGNPGYSLWD